MEVYAKDSSGDKSNPISSTSSLGEFWLDRHNDKIFELAAAILEEKGIKAHSRALAGLAEYQTLFHYEELDERIREY